jgi:anti-anti-sigma factor
MKHHLDKKGQSLNVEVEGDILSTTQEPLRQSLMSLLASEEIQSANWNLLKLDLTRAAMIDSAGLNLLVSLIKLVRNRGARVAATIASPGVHRTFLFTRLDKQMEVTVV